MDEEPNSPLQDPNDQESRPKGMKNYSFPSYLVDPISFEQLETFLNKRNHRGLEAALNRFFNSITAAECAFMLFPNPAATCVKIYMILDTELDCPRVLRVDHLKIQPCVFYFKPMVIDDFQDCLINELQQFLQLRMFSLLLMPLRLKIVPHRAAALVCCVNKSISKLVEMRSNNANIQIPNFATDDFSKADVCFIREYMSDSFATYDRQICRPCPSTIIYCLGKILLHRIGNSYMVVKSVCHQLKTLLNAEACSLYILKFDTLTVIPVYFDKTNCDNIRQIAYKSELGYYCNCTICTAMRRNTLINVSTIITLTDIDKEMDAMVNFKTRNMIACPICHQGRKVYGCLEISNKIDGRRFTELDAALALRMARDFAFFVKKHHPDFIEGDYLYH